MAHDAATLTTATMQIQTGPNFRSPQPRTVSRKVDCSRDDQLNSRLSLRRRFTMLLATTSAKAKAINQTAEGCCLLFLNKTATFCHTCTKRSPGLMITHESQNPRNSKTMTTSAPRQIVYAF